MMPISVFYYLGLMSCVDYLVRGIIKRLRLMKLWSE